MSLSDCENHIGIQNYESHAFLKKLLPARDQSKHPEFAASVVAAVVPTAVIYSQALAQVIDFYLNDEQKPAREEIVELVNSGEKDAGAKVMGFVYEALRKSWNKIINQLIELNCLIGLNPPVRVYSFQKKMH